MKCGNDENNGKVKSPTRKNRRVGHPAGAGAGSWESEDAQRCYGVETDFAFTGEIEQVAEAIIWRVGQALFL